jgi:3-oxoacyl-[acyl-carrier-protein] synthase II
MQDSGGPPRVMVTGVGAITSQGAGADRLWEGVRAGRVAIRPVKNLPMTGLRTALGAEVQVPAIPVHDYAVDGGTREPSLDFALVAAEEAMAASGLVTGDPVPPERWGVVYGSCNGGLVSAEALMRAEESGTEPSWRLGLLVSPQSAAEALASAFGIRGPVLSVNTACASGAHALAHAVEFIRNGRADAVLVGGSDSLAGTTFAGFNSLESLAVSPAAPYSRDRDGLTLGEGAGMLVLAREDVVRAGGTPVLAEVLGYGLSADGYHPTAPHPEGDGAARAIGAALAAAGVAPRDVGYVNGHGTGTAKNDPAEVSGVRKALGEAADTVALSSTKSMVGHLLGAAGAVESIVTVLALRDGVAPPTAGFTQADPQCALDVVPNTARPLATDVAASNNFAFAGANACVVFGRGSARSAGAAAGRRAAAPEPVVVTGAAALSPAGTTLEDLASAYRTGTPLEQGQPWLRVDLDADAYVPARQRRRLDRLSLLAVAAAGTALQHAALDTVERPAHRIGVVLGTGLGPMESMERFARPLIHGGPGLANPAVFPNTVYNAAAGQVAMLLGLTGVTSTVTVTHAAGAAALAVARDLLRSGAADAVVCLAVDAPTDTIARAYRRLPLFAEAAGGAHRLAEGGYALVLEQQAAARTRGARILGELRGHGIASDAAGLGRFDLSGGGLERAVRTALADAALAPHEVCTVWAAAAGLEPADAAEAAALQRVFGSPGPAVETPKRVLGDPIGGGSHLAAALALAAFGSAPAGPAVINSSSLGGTHVALVLTPAREQ